MSHAPQIVITGIGIVSPLGVGWEAFSESLAAGRSAVRAAHSALEKLPIKQSAHIEGFDAKKYVKPRKNIKLMCREIQIGVAAAALAVEHAGLDGTTVDLDRMGVVLGSEMLYGDPHEMLEVFRRVIEHGEGFSIQLFGNHMHELFPLWMLKYLPNMPACHVGIAHGAYGHNNSIVQGDASSLLALAEAMTVMQRGWTDVMIAGGTGCTMRPARAVNISKHQFSQNPDPSRASRPFDANRDGIIVGEGAGAFLLETEKHATARGAKILAKLSGFGRAFELNHPYHRGLENGASSEAIRRSIRAALASADCDPAEIDHVNAHGMSTQLADEFEAQAIQAELGDVPVTALKSYMGNLGAGGGAVELAASVLAFQRGNVVPTLNYETPDPACPVQVIAGQPKRLEKSSALVLSQSSTGQAATVVIQSAG